MLPSLGPEVAHLVCPYSKDYFKSGTESEGEYQFEMDTENENHITISTRLQQNQHFMNQKVSSSITAWLLEENNGRNRCYAYQETNCIKFITQASYNIK